MAIIFDLGRVVVSWDPVGIVRSVRGPDDAETLADRLFNHPDWLELQSFWRFFSGKVVSARVRMMKPEPDIYRYLLVSFDLKAEQCLFIDDSPANVAAAQALGIRGMVFIDATQCRRTLVEQGWLPS